MKRRPRLNLIKKFGEGGWGGGVTLQLCELSSKCILTKKLNLIKKFGERDRGRAGTETKTVCQTVSNEINTKMQLSTQCRACGTINISKYVNNFLSTNPTTFKLSFLESEF